MPEKTLVDSISMEEIYSVHLAPFMLEEARKKGYQGLLIVGVGDGGKAIVDTLRHRIPQYDGSVDYGYFKPDTNQVVSTDNPKVDILANPPLFDLENRLLVLVDAVIITGTNMAAALEKVNYPFQQHARRLAVIYNVRAGRESEAVPEFCPFQYMDSHDGTVSLKVGHHSHSIVLVKPDEPVN